MDKIEKISESKLQQECFVWFWNTFPLLRRTLFHIPNGGQRGRVAGNKMKSIGVVAGVPDFVFVHAGRVHFFELKIDTGSVSGKQKEIHFIFAKQGVPVTIVRSLEQFKNEINDRIENK
jgi:hypothetical protein